MSFDYQRYLASREWGVLRQQVLVRCDDGATCERCLGSARDPNERIVTAVHHRTYRRIGHEALDDLLGVCAGCHQFLSGLSQSDPLRALIEHEVAVGMSQQSVLDELIDNPNLTYSELFD